LAIREQALGPNHPNTATSLNNLALLYIDTGAFDQALPLFERALAIKERALGPDHPDTATSLDSIAHLYQKIGDYGSALPRHERVLAIREQALGPNHLDTASSLNNLALLHAAKGDYYLAIPLFERALAIKESSLDPEHPSIALGLNNLAAVFDDLGAHEKAVHLYEHALVIREESLGLDHPDTAMSLNNLASVHNSMGAHDLALPAYERALSILESALGPDHPDIALCLNNVAFTYDVMGASDQAFPRYERALRIRERALGPDHPDTAWSLSNLAALHAHEGAYDQARLLYESALPIATQAGLPELFWTVTGNLSVLSADLDRPAEAIFWGKVAVNELQTVRSEMSGLDRELQTMFLQSKEGYYRGLADELIIEGRLAEAEQVLRMLKDEEFYGFVRRDASTAGAGETAAYTGEEQAWVARLEEIRDSVVDISQEYQRLQERRRGGDELSEEEAARLEELSGQMRAAREAFSVTLVDLQLAFTDAGPKRSRELGEMGLERLRKLQGTLRDLGPGTVLISTVVTEDTVHLLLTTPEAQVAEKTEIAQADLDRAILELREALTSPASDPRPQARRLFDVLIRPLEPHLDQAKASLLMVSLDTNLRYLPLAALHDGERWLVERWPMAVYTPAADADLVVAMDGKARIGALGVSEGGEVDGQTFSSLAAVPGELDAIVRAGRGDRRGVVPGELYLDEAFTPQQLSDVLAAGTPWVHLATHFHFRPGTDINSFLLLGSGQRLTLADLRHGDYPLVDVEQLTLSACETAMGTHGADGREVEGLAVLAQNLGARAVLATLWSVADESTATWMAEMYRFQAKEGLSKAEAVRQTQLMFLAGGVDVSARAGSKRGARPHHEGAPDGSTDLAGWRHPYYWAPYVLMGNWR